LPILRSSRRVIDLHSHVLPGVDDGPAELAGSLAMAEVAARSGTRRIVATPHLREDFPDVHPTELASRVAELNRELARAGVELEVLPGAEVDITAALETSDEDLRAATLAGNGTDLLLETPYGILPSIFEDLLASVRGRGFRITLAHPELNPSFQLHPDRLGRLAEDGVLIQITARSLQRRSRARALALTAIEWGWGSVLASDAHSADWRPPTLGQYLDKAARRHPGLAERLRWMTEAAPAAILAGGELPEPPPAQRVGLLQRLLGGAAR
jgi:protein-tyrosine phosphatase